MILQVFDTERAALLEQYASVRRAEQVGQVMQPDGFAHARVSVRADDETRRLHLLEDAVVVRRIRVAGRRAGRVFNDDLRVRHHLILQPRDRFGREHDGVSVQNGRVARISEAQHRRIAQNH